MSLLTSLPCFGILFSLYHDMALESQRDQDNTSRTLDGMDLLSLTFRSLDITDTSKQVQEDHHRGRDSPKDTSKKIFNKKKEEKILDTISLNEVAWHDTHDNCWIVIYDFVYDCTDFLSSHPGGQDVLLEYAGRDATLAFIGTGHSESARQSLERYLIGELPPEERIFRVPGGVKVGGF